MGRKSARVRPIAKIAIDGAAISGNSRDCEIDENFPGFGRYAARPYPAGCLFLGFDNSV
jgi:hypothetical protein